MIAIAFVGRLGEDVLSVVVLATSIYNVTGLAVLIGFASAMETFCSQAMGAAAGVLQPAPAPRRC